VEQLQPSGLLQPLEVPSAVWVEIAMDFVEGRDSKSVMLMVVDCFSNFIHFIALGYQYMTTSMAQAFFNDIVHMHGLPSSIVSDRDPIFTNKFWLELFSLIGVKLSLSSAFHPQSDGQSEATNKMITTYLRCLTRDQSRQ
jgi:hypothetical protein